MKPYLGLRSVIWLLLLASSTTLGACIPEDAQSDRIAVEGEGKLVIGNDQIALNKALYYLDERNIRLGFRSNKFSYYLLGKYIEVALSDQRPVSFDGVLVYDGQKQFAVAASGRCVVLLVGGGEKLQAIDCAGTSSHGAFNLHFHGDPRTSRRFGVGPVNGTKRGPILD